MATLVLEETDLVEKLEKVAHVQNTTTEALLDMAVREFLAKIEEHHQATEAEKISIPPQFAQEVAAFERLKPELLKKYPRRVVAIHQGQVVAVGDNRMDVLGIVLDKLGSVPCYIEWVEQETPRRVRMPSVRVVR